MAVSNFSLTDEYDALLTTTLREYRRTLADNVFKGLPFFRWLERKGKKKFDGGESILVPLMYGMNSTPKFYSTYDELDVTPQEGITTARYEWQSFAGSVSISGEEERKNKGKNRLIGLLDAKTKQLEKSMSTRVNAYLHGRFGSYELTFGDGVTSGSGVGSLGVAGKTQEQGFNSLDHIVRPIWGMLNNSSSGTRTHRVGGIDVTVVTTTQGSDEEDFEGYVVGAQTNPWWMNYSNPGFETYDEINGILGATLSVSELDYAGDSDANAWQNLIAAMRSMYTRLSDGETHPDVGLCHEGVLDAYEAALMPLERFTDTAMGDAGFSNLRFKGMTLLTDKGIRQGFPSGTTDVSADATATNPTPLYMLNSDHLFWYVHEDADFTMTPFFRPHNQDARTSQIILMAQLCCDNRQRQGVITLALDGGYTP